MATPSKPLWYHFTLCAHKSNEYVYCRLSDLTGAIKNRDYLVLSIIRSDLKDTNYV